MDTPTPPVAESSSEAVILTCGQCGTKLKVRPAQLKIMKEVQCVKCRNKIPVPADIKPTAAAPAGEAAASPAPAVPASASAAPASDPPAHAHVAPLVGGAPSGLAVARVIELETQVTALQARIGRLEQALHAIKSALGSFHG